MNRKQDYMQTGMPRLPRRQIFAETQFVEPKEGGLVNAHNDPEESGILLAACRIVASGYKAEASRANGGTLFVRAAYELLHRFLEQQFARQSGPA